MKARTLVIAMAAVLGLMGSGVSPASAQTVAPAPVGVPAWWPAGWPIPNSLTTKAPYAPQGTIASYQHAPAGYTPVFTENVSRHGARTLSNSDDGDALLSLWNIAKAQGGLTARGQGLGPEVQRLLAANAAVGYGLLTGSGRAEIEHTGQRMAERLPGLFAGANATTGQIAVTSASQQRVVDSAAEFVTGLEANRPSVAAAVESPQTDDSLLYFHKSNVAYQNYLKNDPRVPAVEERARDLPLTALAARDLLQLSFTPAFVTRLARGEYSAQFGDEIDAAEAVYNLWAVTADMPDEGTWHMDRYLNAYDAAWFGYLDDVTSFYENGPAFSGSDVTFGMAGVLLDHMFSELDAKRAGTSSLIADLNFTHAEEIFPLAALLKLPGSTKQLPTGTLFTYLNDPFRGAQVAPMGANVQWDLFRNGTSYVVRMLYNEKQVNFAAGCRPIRPGSFFYSLSTLEKCYDYQPHE